MTAGSGDPAAPRLLFVSHSAVIAGAELSLLELVGQLSKTGLARPGVVVPSEGPLVARIRELGVPTWTVPYGRWAELPTPIHRAVATEVRNILAVRPLVRLLRAQQPEAVISTTVTIPSGALAARRARVPHVWWIHEYGAPEHGVRFHLGRRRTLRLVGALSRCVIVPSTFLQRELSPHVGAPIRVVQHGPEVSDAADPPPSTRPHRLLVLGHKVPGKGQEDAVRAVALLRSWGVDVALSLVGRGSPEYVEHLERLVSALGVADRVELVEFADDPFTWLARSDVLLMCSRREGFARTIVEAMKLGLPVVAARSGAAPELVADGETGFLYEPGDPDDLAKRIQVLIHDPEKRERLVRQAGEWAQERFTSDRFASSFMKVVHEALNLRDDGRAEPDQVPEVAKLPEVSG